VLAEVDRAAANYQSSLADLATLNAMRASLEQQTKTARAQQRIGETSRLELVRTQIELADTARAELEARLRVQQAIGALEDAVQRPLAWPEPAWLSSPRSAAN
jgi:outer membrane protein TolC